MKRETPIEKILFVWTGNAGCSLMAKFLLEHMARRHANPKIQRLRVDSKHLRKPQPRPRTIPRPRTAERHQSHPHTEANHKGTIRGRRPGANNDPPTQTHHPKTVAKPSIQNPHIQRVRRRGGRHRRYRRPRSQKLCRDGQRVPKAHQQPIREDCTTIGSSFRPPEATSERPPVYFCPKRTFQPTLLAGLRNAVKVTRKILAPTISRKLLLNSWSYHQSPHGSVLLLTQKIGSFSHNFRRVPYR